ncbi:MAG: hypothetical protein CENE_00909 [Candidatus Celerinatantimonas neptuna]|nr:MAG: hypothetical protein CENE_00909 [Candidatus Celerinatantimonas neptuna]
MDTGTFECLENGTVRLSGCWTDKTVSQQWDLLLTRQVTCFDLEQITHIDSAGLAAIITILMMQEDVRSLDIRHCPASMQPLLALYGLEPYLA